ncbi:protein NUCLEAR FUSION DEFECTIVE 4-like [Andrographis paniculata]|uniref:protein NUCLEAR FUSION DEFECTIVE 4-like n=1 Tax=Andrographis paniculata TaxID=175694 RepID=UPI0021E72AD4|nr:protein NUCLEAR FUSION DEFECTIVE 4-like [Andrographis paniculata]
MDPDYNPSRKSLIRNKWVSTAASIWIQCTSGSLYTFSIYSGLLKSTQGYDQSTLGTISVFKDIGGNSGLLSGVLYSSAGGPRFVLLAGAIQCFAGYLLMWLTVTGTLPRSPAWVICLYMLLTAHGVTFFNTADVVTGVHNFPNYSGTIVGIMKGFLGLSGAILIQVYQTIFKNKPDSYLLLLALLPSLNALLLMWFVRILETKEEDEKKHLDGFSFIAVVLAAYLMAVIIVQHILHLILSLRIFTFVLLILLLVSPIVVAIKAQREKSYRMLKSLLEHNLFADEKDLLDEEIIRDDDVVNGGESNVANSQSIGDLNLMQAMRKLSFWLLFLTTACAVGSGLSTVNNLNQIGESLGYSSLEINTLVSLWSIWNFLGRFGAGYISDYFLHVRGCSRPLFIVITLAIMSAGHGMIAYGFHGALYVGSILVGVCYGSQWSLMPTIASEIFGKAHFGTIFNTITVAGPIASYILSVRVMGFIYDEEASKHGGGTCFGPRCFRLAFVIMASVALFGFLVALGLHFLTRSFYKNVVHRRVLISSRSSRIVYDIE